ncbi:MAG: VTT domain-containing protein [Actinomycetota bacterium]|nr:VTT domain-containing protein [Actinomycetota bacterium]
MILALTPLMATLGPLALLLLMGVVFTETGLMLGFFLPGDSLVFTAGVLVASGAMHVPLWLVAAGTFVAATAGDQVGYLVGRRVGPRLFHGADSRLFSRRHASQAQRFFTRHGPKAVVLARFVPVARTFTPVMAGVGDMTRRRFTAYNLVGAVAWAVGILCGGYFLGGVPLVAAHVELLLVGVVTLSLVPGAVELLRRRVRGRASQDSRGRSDARSSEQPHADAKQT